MTQALLNNVNNILDGIYSAEKSGMTDINKKFDKILDLKTVKNSEKDFESDSKQALIPIEEIIQFCKENLSKDSDSESDENNPKETLEEVVMNVAAELVLEDSITAKKQEDISDELITENLINTITEEEPTMQKELALEILKKLN